MISQDLDCPESLIAAGTCPLVGADAANDGEGKAVNSPAEHGIPRHRYLEVARHIASGDVSKPELARRFGVSRAALTMWPKRHSALIEEVRRDLHAEYAGPAGDLILAGATAPAA